jgi:hypothetical protein
VQVAQWKLGAAAIGGSAAIAMGALGAAFCGVKAIGPEPVVNLGSPEASGQTVTTTTPPAVPPTGLASPTVVATPPSGFAIP